MRVTAAYLLLNPHVSGVMVFKAAVIYNRAESRNGKIKSEPVWWFTRKAGQIKIGLCGYGWRKLFRCRQDG